MREEKTVGVALPAQPEEMKRAEPAEAGDTQIERAPGKLVPLKRRIRKKLRVFGACAVYGALYGALMALAFGMLIEFTPDTGSDDPATAIWRLVRPGHLVALTRWTRLGGACGAFGGGVSGIVGIVIGARWGWWIAGAVGGLTLPLLLWRPQPHHQFFGHPQSDTNLMALTVMSLVGSLTGGFLGLRLAYRLRGGKSRLPGVERLAAIINDGRPPLSIAKPQGALTEVAPSAAPAGRGDEPAST